MATCKSCGQDNGSFDGGEGRCEACYSAFSAKSHSGSFEWIAFLGEIILIFGGGLAVLAFIGALYTGEAIFIAPAIATLVFSLVFGALLVALGFIGLELNAIRKSLSSSEKSSSKN